VIVFERQQLNPGQLDGERLYPPYSLSPVSTPSASATFTSCGEGLTSVGSNTNSSSFFHWEWNLHGPPKINKQSFNQVINVKHDHTHEQALEGAMGGRITYDLNAR